MLKYVDLWEPMQEPLLLALAVMGAGTAAFAQDLRRRRSVGSRFRARARQRGLSEEQARFLLRAARRGHPRDPVAILDSLQLFDACSASLIEGCKGDGRRAAEQMGAIRCTLGYDHLDPDQPMRTTRQLEPGQRLSLWLVGSTTPQRCTGLVVARDELGFAVALASDSGSGWSPGRETAARLRWGRVGEFRFRTVVAGMDPRTGIATLKHCERVNRVQPRRLFRWNTRFSIRLYPVHDAAPADGDPVDGVVTDISAGGFGTLVQRRIASGALLVVDPGHRGPFPLAGLACQVIGTAPGGQGHRLRLRFVDLPPRTEAEIVRAIYRCQAGQGPNRSSPAGRG